MDSSVFVAAGAFSSEARRNTTVCEYLSLFGETCFPLSNQAKLLRLLLRKKVQQKKCCSGGYRFVFHCSALDRPWGLGYDLLEDGHLRLLSFIAGEGACPFQPQ